MKDAEADLPVQLIFLSYIITVYNCKQTSVTPKFHSVHQQRYIWHLPSPESFAGSTQAGEFLGSAEVQRCHLLV